MPSDDPIASASKGAMEGALKFTAEQIKSMVTKFLQGDLGFIEDEETIQIVKSEREKPEWKLYKKYIKDINLRLSMEMGFSLRYFEETEQKTKLLDLRNKIVRRFGTPGLHVAELVQNEIFGRYIGLVIGKTDNEVELEERINSVLMDIDKYVIFIQSMDDEKKIAGAIISRINTLVPKAIIVFSRGPVARTKAGRIMTNVAKAIIPGYQFERQQNEKYSQEYYFIIKEKP